ncbi:MAG: hypothetical protein LBJ07_03355 [Actinomycetes bacterium]|jgi:hypothetical protein|nr:hypothetical protein [Actinomycetes bacterium]
MESRKQKRIALAAGLTAALLAGVFFWTQIQSSASLKRELRQKLAAQEEIQPEKQVSLTLLDELPEGMSAVTVSTDAVHALGGQLARGMKVTLMAVLTDGRVEALVRDVAVLSADVGLDGGMGRYGESGTDGSGDDGGRGGLLGGDATESLGTEGAAISWVTLALPDTQVTRVLAAAYANTLHLILPGEVAGVGEGLTGEEELTGEDSVEESGTEIVAEAGAKR